MSNWSNTVLQESDGPQPYDTYIKGDMQQFNGIVFGKFASTQERDLAVKKVQQKRLSYGGQDVWAKPDQVLEVRVLESVLFAAKKMMVDWQWHKKNLWVNKDLGCLTLGSEHVLSVEVVESCVKVTYGNDWEDYIFNSEHPDNTFWKSVLETAANKLKKKKSEGTKGMGKGKPHE